MEAPLVAIDFDGVVVDSLHIKESAFGHALRAQGLSDNEVEEGLQLRRQLQSIPRIQKFRRLAKRFGIPEEEQGPWAIQADEHFTLASFHRVLLLPPDPHVIFACRFVTEAHLVSGAPLNELKAYVQSWSIAELFSSVAGDCVDKAKPLKNLRERHPGMLTVYVGDQADDEAAAARADVAFIRYRTGHHDHDGAFGFLADEIASLAQ